MKKFAILLLVLIFGLTVISAPTLADPPKEQGDPPDDDGKGGDRDGDPPPDDTGWIRPKVRPQGPPLVWGASMIPWAPSFIRGVIIHLSGEAGGYQAQDESANYRASFCYRLFNRR
jgi:hypothetical protein